MAQTRKIWDDGGQWAVTNRGMEAASMDYAIDASELGMLLDDRVTPMCVWRMAEKTWTDLDDFVKVFRFALKVHNGSFKPLPQGWEAATIDVIVSTKRARAQHAEIEAALETAGLNADGCTLSVYWDMARKIYGDDYRP